MKTEVSKFVGQQIKRFRKERKMTQKELGLKVGVKHNTISSYENGTNEPEQDIIFSIARALDISINDLFPSIKNENESINDKKDLNNKYQYFDVSVAAGNPATVDSVMENDINEIEIPDFIMGKYAGSKDIFTIRTNGDSMNKIIPHNSVIAIKPVELSTLKENDIVVFSNDEEYSVKRFYNDKDNKRFIFRPDSTDKRFTDYAVSYEDSKNLKLYGKVVVYIVTCE